MNQPSFFYTLPEMGDDFRTKLRDGFKGDCPCCGRWAQVYHRRIHSHIARVLIKFYRAGGAERFLHYAEVVKAIRAGSFGDFGTARYWGLIEGQASDDSAKSSSGMWKLTQRGVDYIEGRLSVPEYAMVFDDTVLGFADKELDIRAALGDKFNYQELMTA